MDWNTPSRRRGAESSQASSHSATGTTFRGRNTRVEQSDQEPFGRRSSGHFSSRRSSAWGDSPSVAAVRRMPPFD